MTSNAPTNKGTKANDDHRPKPSDGSIACINNITGMKIHRPIRSFKMGFFVIAHRTYYVPDAIIYPLDLNALTHYPNRGNPSSYRVGNWVENAGPRIAIHAPMVGAGVCAGAIQNGANSWNLSLNYRGYTRRPHFPNWSHHPLCAAPRGQMLNRPAIHSTDI